MNSRMSVFGVGDGMVLLLGEFSDGDPVAVADDSLRAEASFKTEEDG